MIHTMRCECCDDKEEQINELRSLVRELAGGLSETTHALIDIEETGRDYILHKPIEDYIAVGEQALARVPEDLR